MDNVALRQASLQRRLRHLSPNLQILLSLRHSGEIRLRCFQRENLRQHFKQHFRKLLLEHRFRDPEVPFENLRIERERGEGKEEKRREEHFFDRLSEVPEEREIAYAR